LIHHNKDSALMTNDPQRERGIIVWLT